MNELPNVHKAEGSSSADQNPETINEQVDSTQESEASSVSRAIGMIGVGALYYGLLVPGVVAGNIIDRARGKWEAMRAGYGMSLGDTEANKRQPIDNPFLREA